MELIIPSTDDKCTCSRWCCREPVYSPARQIPLGQDATHCDLTWEQMLQRKLCSVTQAEVGCISLCIRRRTLTSAAYSGSCYMLLRTRSCSFSMFLQKTSIFFASSCDAKHRDPRVCISAFRSVRIFQKPK